MGRLLIDYTKNTAPLQVEGDRQRLEVGMTIRYHEPEMSLDELDASIKDLGFSPPKVKPKDPRYPLQMLAQSESDLRTNFSPSITRKRSKSPQRPSRIVNFEMPPISCLRQKRFQEAQKLKMHVSTSDLDFFTNHSMSMLETDRLQTRGSMMSNDASFALSIQTAPLPSPSSTSNNNNLINKPVNLNLLPDDDSLAEESSISSLEGEKTALDKMSPKNSGGEEEEEEEEEESEDERRSSNFLPTSLTTSMMNESMSSLGTSSKHSQQRRKSKRKKKRPDLKRRPSLDDWFNRGDDSGASLTIEEACNDQQEEQSIEELSLDDHSTHSKSSHSRRVSRRERIKSGKKKEKRSSGSSRRIKSSDDGSVCSRSSVRSSFTMSTRSSITSMSTRSLLGGSKNGMAVSFPLGPRRRMLPLRSKSFENSGNRSTGGSTAASANTRRGGRRPGMSRNGTNGTSTRRMTPARTKSTDSFRSLKSIDNSFSFMAGSRIRVRTFGPGGSIQDDDDLSIASSRSSHSRRSRRGMMGRAQSCEDMPSLLRGF